MTEMKVTYADYGETKKRFDKSTAELDRTRADLASCQEDKRKLQGNVEVLTAEIKKLEGSIGKNEAKIAEQQRQIDGHGDLSDSFRCPGLCYPIGRNRSNTASSSTASVPCDGAVPVVIQ